FLIVAGGHHLWRLPNVSVLEGRVAGLLRSLGLTSKQATLSIDDATSGAWRDAATELGTLLLKDSRLDVSKTERLVIVPDGPLWHLPFEILVAPGSDNRLLIDSAPIRYAPTLGLAVPGDRSMRPVRRTAVAAARAPSSERDDATQAAIDRLAIGVGIDGRPAEQLRPPIGAPAAQAASAFDLLAVTVESEIDPASPYAWRPAPLDRTAASLGNWMRLAGGAPQRLALGSVHTAAENALKTGRSSRRDETALPTGWEMFHASCGLLASGAETALVSRWVTGGATGRDLLREFAAEAPHASAPEAWLRSVALTRQSRLDPSDEPRLEATFDDEPPTATHPFFWAGYLVLDTGFDPAGQTPDEQPAAEGQKVAAE
ncbi:MAG: CHAT domain-containing protein, partial [Planctomycetota bacterium]